MTIEAQRELPSFAHDLTRRRKREIGDNDNQKPRQHWVNIVYVDFVIEAQVTDIALCMNDDFL